MFDNHAFQHEIVVTGMGDLVPDTIFVSGEAPHLSEMMSQMSDGSRRFTFTEELHLIVQDAVRLPMTLLDAIKDARAEKKIFLSNLLLFLERYDYMRRHLGCVPEITALGSRNLLVDVNGNIRIPDTNGITRTTENDGQILATYRKKHKASENINSPDGIMRQLEKIIRVIEHGLVKDNPQG